MVTYKAVNAGVDQIPAAPTPALDTSGPTPEPGRVPVSRDEARQVSWQCRFAGDLLFLAAAVVVMFLRLQPLLARHAPTGVDWGNMLTIGHAYLGHNLGSGGIDYPPLVPLLAVVATALARPAVIFPVLAAIGSIAPAAGLYVALRPMHRGVRAALACGLLLLASSSAEQAVWGGLADLIGMACLPPLLVSLAMSLERPTRGRLLAFGASLFVLAAASYLALAEAAVAMLAVVAVTVVLTERGQRMQLRRRLLPLAVAAMPTLLLFPIYLRILMALRIGFAANQSQVLSIAAKFDYLFREDPDLWKLCIAVAAFLPVLAFVRRHSFDAAFHRAGTGLLVAAAVVSIGFPNVRFFYLVPVAATFGVALFLMSFDVRADRLATWVVAGSVVAVLGVNLSVEGQGAFRLYPQQVRFYGNVSMSPHLLQAVEWLGSHTGRTDLVAVSAVHGSPIGWWVQGLAQRAALTAAEPQLLYLKGQRRADAQAKSILTTFPSMAAIARARELRVSYIFIARSSGQYHPRRTNQFVQQHPALVAFSNQGALILRTGTGP